MKRKLMFAKFTALSVGMVLLSILIIPMGAVFAQESTTIQTDKDIYLLGEPVVITGSGFIPGPIDITVLRPDHRIETVPGVVADSDGDFQVVHYPPRFLPLLPEYVPGLIPGRYKITATDDSNSAYADYTVTSKPSKDLGRIILIKETIPDGAPDGFSFVMDYGYPIGYPNGLIMRDGAELDSGYVLDPGIYTIDESSIPPGWQLSSIDIKDKSGGSYSSGSTTTIDLAPGETVTVTYTNTGIEPVDTKGAVKADIVELLGMNPGPPPVPILGDTVGSVIFNTTASGKLIANVNMDAAPNLEDYDVIVSVWYNPPSPGGQVFIPFDDVLKTNAKGHGNANVSVDIDLSSTNGNSIWVSVSVREGPTLPPTPPPYIMMPPPVEVPLK